MRPWLVASLAVALLLLGLLVGLVMPRHGPVYSEAIGRIKEGMTQREIHAILGGPPGDYRTGRRPERVERARGYRGPWRLTEEWVGDDGDVIVDYIPHPTGEETIVYFTYDNLFAVDPGPRPLEKARRWLAGLLGPKAP